METGRTQKGLIYKRFVNRDCETPVVIFGGMNIMPGSGYFCDFPDRTAEIFGEAIVVYQEGVSGNLFKTGWYTEATERKQLEEALKLVNGRRFVPVTHSLSSVLGMKLLDPNYRAETGARNVLPGVITSVFTTIEDSLVDVDRTRKILGIPALPLFKIGRYLPLPVPFYPLRDFAAHSKFGIEDDGLIANRWVNTRSADYCFNCEKVVDSLNQNQEPVGVVTLQDRIFSADKQREVFDKLRAEFLEVDSGHRWMVDDESCDAVIDAIERQLRKYS